MPRVKLDQPIEKSTEKRPDITEILETMRDDQRQFDRKLTELANRLASTKQKPGKA
jgi:hypothetical protein